MEPTIEGTAGVGRAVILVSGAPGSGKTTVARALAKEMGFALLSKDVVKESLYDSLGAELAEERVSPLLSRAAIDLLWDLAEYCPRVILEANFRPKSEHEQERARKVAGRKLELYCRCTMAEAARRFAERAVEERHHAAHSMKTISEERLAEYDRPIGVCPVIEVDTMRPVDVARLVEEIRGYWPDVGEKR